MGQGTCLDRVRTRTRKKANKSSGDLGQGSSRGLHWAKRDKQLILDQLCCLGLREGGRKEENPSRRSGSLCKYFQIKVKLGKIFTNITFCLRLPGYPKNPFDFSNFSHCKILLDYGNPGLPWAFWAPWKLCCQKDQNKPKNNQKVQSPNMPTCAQVQKIAQIFKSYPGKSRSAPKYSES